MQLAIGVRLCAVGCASMIAFMPLPGAAQILTSGDSVQTDATPVGPSPTTPASYQRVNAGPAVLGDSAKPAAKPHDGQAGKVARCALGAVGGALLAGFLASAVGGSKQLVNSAMAVGAGAGCALGYNWTPRDKQAVEDASQDAFDDPAGGQRDLVTPDSKEHLTLVNTGTTTTESREVEFQHFDSILPPPAGSRVIARPYRALNVLHLRSSPDESSGDNIVGRFEPAEMVEVEAQSPDGRWAVIGESGVIIGYAPMGGLAPLEATQTLRRTVTAKARPDTPRVAKGKAAPQVALAPRGQIQTARLMASTQCKSLVATSGNQQQKKEIKGCSAPGGKWLLA